MTVLKRIATGSSILPQLQLKMTSQRDSWVNAYENVDFDVPLFKSSLKIPGKEDDRAERQAMLPSGSGTTKSEHSH